jgi:hypothetical protein
MRSGASEKPPLLGSVSFHKRSFGLWSRERVIERPSNSSTLCLTRCTNVHTIMTYEWDRKKAGAKVRKQGIRFSDAQDQGHIRPDSEPGRAPAIREGQ